MRTPLTRRLAGVAGLLAATAWLAADADLAAAPKDAESAVAADIAFLQKGLAKTPEKRAVPTLKAAAMNLALAGSADLRKQALKVAEAIGKKDFAAAKTAAAKLTPAAGDGGDAAKLAAAGKYDISEVMSAYRAEKVGGMNLEKDIKTAAKKDAKLAAVVAARSALLADYTAALPVDKAAGNDANKKKWEGLSQDQLKASKEVLDEAAKGSASPALAKKVSALEATCTACHNQFRD